MPPLIPTLNPSDLIASVLQNEDVLDVRAVLQSLVGKGLDSDGLSTTATFVGSEDDTRLAVVDTVGERGGGETGEDDRVEGDTLARD